MHELLNHSEPQFTHRKNGAIHRIYHRFCCIKIRNQRQTLALARHPVQCWFLSFPFHLALMHALHLPKVESGSELISWAEIPSLESGLSLPLSLGLCRGPPGQFRARSSLVLSNFSVLFR